MQITDSTTIGAVRGALAATIARAADDAATSSQNAALFAHAPDDDADDRLEWGAALTDSLDARAAADRTKTRAEAALSAFENAIAAVSDATA